MENPFRHLTHQQARLYAAEAAQRNLRLWDNQFPDDKRPAQAIQAANDFARGKCTAADLAHCRAAAIDAVKSVPVHPGYVAAQQAAFGAADAAHPNAHRAAHLTVRRTLRAVRHSLRAEKDWQKTRLVTIRQAPAAALKHFNDEETRLLPQDMSVAHIPGLTIT